MDHTIYIPKLIKKITVYTSAALIFTAAPSLSVSAAETASQSESSSIPAETLGSSPSNTESLPAQTNTQTPADSASVTPETPSDTITVTPLPEPAPADQNTFDVTMQGTVYASSQKGLNVRSGRPQPTANSEHSNTARRSLLPERPLTIGIRSNIPAASDM